MPIMKAFLFFLLYASTYGGTTFVQGCKKSNAGMTPTPADTIPISQQKKYLALGDSYTIGQGVNIQDRFPHIVVKMLWDEGVKIEDPRYIATTGWTTANLMTAINSQVFG